MSRRAVPSVIAASRAALLSVLCCAGPAGLSHAGEAGTAESAAAFFGQACAACHGADGKGGGPAAAQLSTPLPDLTRIAERAGGIFPDQQVYEAIEGLAMPTAHGTREMPVWGALMLSEELGDSTSRLDARTATEHTEERLYGLVGYLRTLQID